MNQFPAKSIGSAELAFPDYRDTPACGVERLNVLLVALDVRESLFLPEVGVGCGNDFAILAGVHVPEASVDKNDLSQAGKNQVRPAWEVLDVQRVAITETMNQRANPNLGLGVPAPDVRHVAVALFGTEDVCHELP